MVVLMISMVSAAPQHAEQDPNSGGGCGGGGGGVIVEEEPIIVQAPLDSGIFRYVGKPTSFKHRWVEVMQRGCTVVSVYETYRVGVCLPGELRCDVKQYADRVRWHTLPDCVYHK